MTNPFDRTDISHFVLIDQEGRHSLWPDFADLPTGWTVAHGLADRAACLEYVQTRWTDMRPEHISARQ
jgi:MbtH protein